jgi:hypothetical protein
MELKSCRSDSVPAVDNFGAACQLHRIRAVLHEHALKSSPASIHPPSKIGRAFPLLPPTADLGVLAFDHQERNGGSCIRTPTLS